MLVEFDAFIRVVDEIGGLDIYVPETINDPWYPDHFYGYDPFYLNSGQQHLDGPTALKYARTRHGDNDYERARRQQDVLFAIRDKVFSLNMMPTLVQKAPTFFSTISDSIVTDMTLDQMLQLGVAAQDVAESNIRSGVIDANYVVGYYTPEGASVLIPNRYAIGPFLNYIFWLDE
jgi:anionic cell wall polymer biosynthesis LytR-Cps2A-Psr (LCP) family protein